MAQWLRERFASKKNQPDPVIEGYTEQIIAGLGPAAAQGEDNRVLEGTNKDAIEDEGLMRQLDNLCITPARDYTIFMDKEGNIVPEGTIDAQPHTIHVSARPVPWALALRVAVTKVMATRFITRKDALIYKNRTRNDFLKVKRLMSRSDRSLFTPYVNFWETYSLTAFDDDVDGQKMLALKTSGRSFSVGVRNQHTGSK